MKKFYTTTLFIIFSLGFCKAQWVTIPDSNFVKFLQQQFPTCMNGSQMDTTCAAIKQDTIIDCGGENISSLNGIQYFTSLTYLYCDDNQLTGLPVLPNSLTLLSCINNQLTSLPALPSFLTHLECGGNQLIGLPTLPNSLTLLSCGNNQLNSLPALKNSLTYINCSFNQLNSLPALPNSLTQLYCADNQLTSLPALPYLLGYIDCSANQLTGLPALPNSLGFLYCGSNQLTSLPALPNSLIYLECGLNQLTGLPALPDSLTNLQCGSNQLTSLPALPNYLTGLFCLQNQLITLPALPSSLTDLGCSYNQLTSLPALPPSLYQFDVSYNIHLNCMPPLLNFTGVNFFIDSTNITCLPNVIRHTGYIAAIDTMPVCNIFNSSGCPIAWNIQGSLFNDENANCRQDSSEHSLYNVKVNLYQSGNLVQSGYFSGNYGFKTTLATYDVRVDTNNLPFYVLCPITDDTTVNIIPADSLKYGINFSLTCKPGFDIGAWDVVGYDRFIPGDTTTIYISAGDVMQGMYGASCGATGLSGQVKVVINGPVKYNTPLVNALTPSVSFDTLIYSITDFSKVHSTTDFNFSVITNTSAQRGDAVCFTVIITPTAGDNNLSNNTLTHCFTVSNSHDPNEKEVSPTGALPYPFNDWLTYTIHFQNTGTAAAKHIQVLDTLDANLDPETFQLLSYSFQPLVQITGRNVAFDFVNINLPDSNASKQGSTGYVSYRVKPITNLAQGSTIKNTASIYFDFNSPVVTNTTTNTVEVATGVSNVIPQYPLTLYPNPTSEQLTVSSKQLRGSEINVTDILGRTILTQTATDNKTLINVSKLTSGVYFVHIHSDEMNEVRKFVKE